MIEMGTKDVKGGFALPIQTVTVVPSTQDETKKISEAEFKARISLVRRRMAKMFGGYTEVKGHGGFILGSKEIREKVVLVTAYAQRSKFAKNKDSWIAFVKKLKKDWGQDSMGIIIENDLIII